jgi:signal transduction histidine kinase
MIATLETNNDITERKRAEQALEDLAGRLVNAQEEERSRIGRELHDHVSQRLGLLAIKIDQLRLNSTATIASDLDDLRQHTSEITDDIHGLSHRLHSAMLDHLGLVPALQRLAKECAQRFAIPIISGPQLGRYLACSRARRSRESHLAAFRTTARAPTIT